MIISASRRTDIPSYYSDWFFNRIKEGFVLVRNPMNFHQISKISLAPEVVDGIVFWTKNPLPMLNRLDELKDYMYYFQFTLTSYGKDVEQNIPLKNDSIIETFKALSEKIGADRVIWRYDPILISKKYSFEYHVRYFEKLAEELHRYTRKVTISFIDDDYRGVKSNIKELALQNFPPETQRELSSQISAISHHYGLQIDTCAEHIDLGEYGIKHARCIDDRLFEQLLGCRLKIDKDKNQRLECGCISSIDIGMYNTCLNGCRYCYANYSKGTVEGNFALHDPFSPLLCGAIGCDDKINERAVKSNRDSQTKLFDF
jgi:DNA repair photolyase